MRAILSRGILLVAFAGVGYLGFQTQNVIWDTISGWFSDGPKAVSLSAPQTFQCQQPVPQFALGLKSDPSEVELRELCECIWRQLTPWARQAA